MEVDLLSLDSVVRFAEAWNARSAPLHVLINNAGIFSIGGWYFWFNKYDAEVFFLYYHFELESASSTDSIVLWIKSLRHLENNYNFGKSHGDMYFLFLSTFSYGALVEAKLVIDIRLILNEYNQNWSTYLYLFLFRTTKIFKRWLWRTLASESSCTGFAFRSSFAIPY